MGKKNARWWAVVFLLALPLLHAAWVFAGPLFLRALAHLSRPGIQVTIRNAEATPIRAVVVHVTGASYQLGDIASGESAQVVVRSTGESHLEVTFTEADGRTKQLNAGGYCEPGYRGTIRLSIRDGVIGENEQQVNVY